MSYKIECDGSVIAQFETSDVRDICLNVLINKYPRYMFKAINY